MDKRGFTLVELIVAIALFGLVMIMALSTLLSVTNNNRTAQTSREALDNIDFALDDIIREARLGKNYHCDVAAGAVGAPQDCISPASSFALTRLDTNDIVQYAIVTTGGRSTITKQVTSGGMVGPVQILTSDGVNISLLKFLVTGSGEKDGKQARALIALRATIKDDKVARDINLQTTISQRATDN
jgi:prepilin-type N-terminal cleavage/methylation domain-containing protein